MPLRGGLADQVLERVGHVLGDAGHVLPERAPPGRVQRRLHHAVPQPVVAVVDRGGQDRGTGAQREHRRARRQRGALPEELHLDPVATDTYLKTIYGAYEQAVGDEFGKTIMGFRADETDFTGVSPWTPKLLETFQAIKGYDFKPYIPLIFGGHLTPEALRAKADYADVWSRMFRDNFYKHMGDWCSSRNMEFMIHLNHEETMMALVGSEGSFWRDMRYTGVPGIEKRRPLRSSIFFRSFCTSGASRRRIPRLIRICVSCA